MTLMVGQCIGFRPIICLKSDVELVDNGDGTYKLDRPIIAKAEFDSENNSIKVNVISHKNPITEIKDPNGNNLLTGSIDGTAEKITVSYSVTRNKTYKFTIKDNMGNTEEVAVKVEGYDEFEIACLEDLIEFRDLVNAGNNYQNKTVVQTADIDINEGKYTINETTGEITFDETATKWTPIADKGTTSSLVFWGTYDGDGHTISGLYIDSTSQNQGLFGYASVGKIENLNIKNSKITSTKDYVGAIVGEGYNLENCSSSAEVSGQSRVGGIAGTANTVDNCYNTGLIVNSSDYTGGIAGRAAYVNNSYNLGKIIGKSKTGGIVGMYISSICNCYNLGEISGEYMVGGIAGEQSGNNGQQRKFKNCYNIGKVTGTSQVGGILGEDSLGACMEKCYNMGAITGDTYIGAIYGTYAMVPTDCYYENGTANYGNGYGNNSGCTAETRTNIISYIIALDEYVADTNNVNGGYPLLAWQVAQ